MAVQPHAEACLEDLSSALFTDLYQLTMAQTYWRSGVNGDATFSLFFREFPDNRAYYVFVGLQDALDYLQDFKFSNGDMDALRAFDLFEDGFLSFLSSLRFTGDVRAMGEATLFFENEPVLEVSGPIIECQLTETYLLNQVSLQSMLATKAARVVHAARGRQVVDFAARRTHGTDAAQDFFEGTHLVVDRNDDREFHGPGSPGRCGVTFSRLVAGSLILRVRMLPFAVTSGVSS